MYIMYIYLLVAYLSIYLFYLFTLLVMFNVVACSQYKCIINNSRINSLNMPLKCLCWSYIFMVKKTTQINHNMLNGCHLPLIFNVMSTPPLILIFKQFVQLPLIFYVLPPPPYINFRRFVHLPLIFHVPLILGIKE